MEREIARHIARGEPFDFAATALEVFAYQFARNVPYREYCRRLGRTPAEVRDWREIPAVATAAFKLVELACGPPERVFLTSGTTRGKGERGRHLVPCLELYLASALAGFSRYVLPDGARPAVLVLLPPPALLPDSSLVQMCAWVGEAFAPGGAEYFAGARGLDLARLLARLGEAEAGGEPVSLLGPTAAFARLFAAAAAEGRRFRLGPGSRVMDTGGSKGMPRPLSRGGFLRACWTALGVPGYHCVNEYGMTELCSQFYDSVLADRVAGRGVPRRKLHPPWVRTLVVDPETLEPVPPGREGLLRHFDLANCGSVLAVQTADIGRAAGDGFEVLGRASAEPRGCGLLLAEV